MCMLLFHCNQAKHDKFGWRGFRALQFSSPGPGEMNVLALGQLSLCWRTGLDLTLSTSFLGFNTSIFFRSYPGLEGTQISSKSNSCPCTGHPNNPTVCFLGLCCSRSWALMDSWALGGELMTQRERMVFMIPAFVCWRPGSLIRAGIPRQPSRLSFSSRFHSKVWSHPAEIKHRFLKFLSPEKKSFKFYVPSFGAFLTTPLML